MPGEKPTRSSSRCTRSTVGPAASPPPSGNAGGAANACVVMPSQDSRGGRAPLVLLPAPLSPRLPVPRLRDTGVTRDDDVGVAVALAAGGPVASAGVARRRSTGRSPAAAVAGAEA